MSAGSSPGHVYVRSHSTCRSRQGHAGVRGHQDGRGYGFGQGNIYHRGYIQSFSRGGCSQRGFCLKQPKQCEYHPEDVEYEIGAA